VRFRAYAAALTEEEVGLARATGRSFGVPGGDLEVFWTHTVRALGGWLRSEAGDLEETWELRLPFGAVRLQLGGGQVEVVDGPVAGVDAARTVQVADVDIAEIPEKNDTIFTPALVVCRHFRGRGRRRLACAVRSPVGLPA
jgi:hypothetical protein